MEISYTHIPAPNAATRSVEYYGKGWNFADDAMRRHGPDACARLRKALLPASSYDQGAADRFDGKPHRYGK